MGLFAAIPAVVAYNRYRIRSTGWRAGTTPSWEFSNILSRYAAGQEA
jgi:biopolymer transport protein ExbB/TolQ